METYHKINSLFKRDNSSHKLIYGDWAMAEFEYLQDNTWEFTEKVDGTNIRIGISNGRQLVNIEFGGRTDKAIIPKKLHDFLESVFKAPSVLDNIHQLCLDHGIDDLVLFGEGYGPGIQKGGGNYREDSAFVLFDIKIGRFWLTRDSVDSTAARLGLDSVPVLGYGSLHEAVRIVSGYLESAWGPFEAEGIVARPEVPMFDRQGRRIIAKIKGVDFK